jgi:16S rRNA (guanine527-N7)-methyltransferase
VSEPAENRLNRLCERYSLDSDAREKLFRLTEWSLEVEISGTAIDSLEDAVDRHIADSLVALECERVREARNLVDIGSGLGFPGLALAVVMPGAHVVVVDSVRKKMEAAARIASDLAIENIECVWGRAEEIAERGSPHREAFDLVTARALADLGVLLEYASPLLQQGGHLVAWKGTPSDAELAGAVATAPVAAMSLPAAQRVEPFRGSRRALYISEKQGATPERLPRRAGVALKKPLA